MMSRTIGNGRRKRPWRQRHRVPSFGRRRSAGPPRRETHP
jgi:hypothetical protein